MSAPVVPAFGVAVPLCLMCRAELGGPLNSGTTIGPGTPNGARWMWPATNVSWRRLRICVLNLIVPSVRTLISVWPLAADVVGGVSFLAVIFACRAHSVPLPLPLPLFADAAPTVGTATAQTTTRQRIRRRISGSLLRVRLVGYDLPETAEF